MSSEGSVFSWWHSTNVSVDTSVRWHPPNEAVADTPQAPPCWYMVSHPDLCTLLSPRASENQPSSNFIKQIILTFIVHQKRLRSAINMKWPSSSGSPVPGNAARAINMLITYISPARPYLPSGDEIMHGTFLRLLFVKPWWCTGALTCCVMSPSQL